MQTQPSQPPWTQPGRSGQASDWIHGELEGLRITGTGPIEQPHVRLWSSVLRVPTSAGNIYFNATASILMHESAVTQALSRWQPGLPPTLLATDYNADGC